MNWIARTLFGLSADEIRSLRSQNEKLLARLEAIVDERDGLREELRQSRADEVLALQKIVDAERVDSGRFVAFGVGPQPKEQPDVDWSKITGGRAARLVERKNREFLKTHPLRPNSGWEPEAPPEEVEQAS